MNILSLFTFTIFAAETIVSPLTSDYQPASKAAVAPKPDVSFSELALPTPTPLPSPIPTPTPAPRQTKKQTITIALLGDSMMDTLGPTAPHLQTALKRTYPETTFVVKNFGVGGTTITSGIDRIPTMSSVNPDVVVLESFGYNPTGEGEGALDQHWVNLAGATDGIKHHLPNTTIVIAATIAPNSLTFGDGAPGIAFSPEDKIARTETIKKYIETTIQFAKSEHIPLADAYHASVDSSGNGKHAFINPSDHIHYSDAGRALMGSKIAGTIVANRLLE